MRKFIFLFIIILKNCVIQPDLNQLTIILSGDPKNLDPAYATDVRSGQVTSLIYDNLLHYGHNLELVPGLARYWEISDDGLLYKFYLVDSVQFQNGTFLNSKHVKSSFERILNPEINSRRSWLFDNVIGSKRYQNNKASHVEGFKAYNDTIFEINLKKPFSPFLSFLAMPSAAIITLENNKIIGSGPWILQEWVRDGHFIFKSNQNYFNGIPKINKLKIRILPESLPRVAEFITGYLDIMEIPNSEYDYWLNDTEWKNEIQLINQLNTYYIGLNCSREPFNDVRVRQAVNYAVNKQKIINNIFSGRGKKAGGPVPPVLLNRKENLYYNYNPEKAKKLLIEAGYQNGFEVELWQSQSKELFQITEIIQDQLKKVNIKVNIVRNDWNLYSDAVRKGIPDMYYRSWWADYPNAENFLGPLFKSDISRERWTRYENVELDSIINNIQSENNEKQRIELSRIANDLLKKDAPWIYLWHMQSAVVSQKNLKNWTPSIMFNAEKYDKIEKSNS